MALVAAVFPATRRSKYAPQKTKARLQESGSMFNTGVWLRGQDLNL
jgi:hypothetical protein